MLTTAQTAEKWLIDKARINPLWFIYYLTEQEPALHHRMWVSRIFNFDDRRFYRLNFIAPRESAKSHVAIYSLLWYMARFPWATNAIVSVSSTIAEKRLEMMRNLIDNNERFQNIFPWIHVDLLQRNTITQMSLVSDALYSPKTSEIQPISYAGWRSLITRIGSPKDPTINAGGISSKSLIGSRWNGIFLMDDIIDHTMLTDKAQEDILDMLTLTYIPALQENAKAINIGTRWMVRDVPARLQENPAWHTIEIPAIRVDPDTGERQSYWPSWWPLKKLDAKKFEMHNDALFDVMYLNDPQALKAARFTQDGLGQGMPDLLPPFVAVYVGTDFAIGLQAQHDYTCFSAIAFDAANKMYILHQVRFRATPDVILSDLIDFCNWTLNKFGMLTNVLFERVGFQVNFEFDLRTKAPHLPTQLVALAGDKDFKISSLAQRSNDKEVYHNLNDPAYPEYYAEALNYSPKRWHDDMLDSVVIALLHHIHDQITVTRKSIRSKHLIKVGRIGLPVR